MPYLIGQTDEGEKALFLRRDGVPDEALVYVFGRDPMYGYRAEHSLGKVSRVGTTVKDPQRWPVHLGADENHRWRCGERVDWPTTVAADCMLGVAIVTTASAAALTAGYQAFQPEALNVPPDYRPETVNTEGERETQTAWQPLFPGII